MSIFSLEGKVALVTGAGRGIGRGIAEELAAQGARVACAARTVSQLEEAAQTIRDAGGEAMAVELDVGDMASHERALDAVVEQWGSLDILVNNAGVNARQPIDEVTEENYDRIMNVNLKGLYFLAQKAARRMAKGGGGKIINIGSLTTGYALTQVSVYTATKGAVGQLTKSQAIEFGKDNIQVNAICPGFVVTPLTDKIWSDPTMQKWVEPRLAAGRLATPKDMAGTAAFLASPASDYVTGQVIYVDGGFMAGDNWPLPGAATT
ncbi:MAG: NAD(P)-dependent dehydrogenase (short-subunit alcohol dehydrogenase family) [Limisphaerales bacterium]|jgi:NAD(P)-dependent dehydrogenase (short-subunit alcohol dehydrogenase family)